MARPRKRWRHSEGRRGQSVAIYEPRLGSDLRWDYRDEDGERCRPWVDPPRRVRNRARDSVDPILERQAIEECRRFFHELRGASIQRRRTAHDLTVAEAFSLYHDPRDGNLPKSRSARIHHTGSREFWTERFGADRLWNDATPNITEAGIRDLVAEGMAPTARKRFQNLRTVANWLRTKMRLRGLEDPTLGVDINELTAGHEPQRPRYTAEQVERMVEASEGFGWRMNLFTTLLADQGGRGGQTRQLPRSHFNPALDHPPPEGVGPHGYIVLPAVKRQRARPSLLTARARAAIDAAIAGPLAEWEAEYQAGTLEDYPLIPGGRTDDRGDLILEPISDTALRRVWPRLEKAARVPTKERRGFHGARRMWANEVKKGAGSDAATHAGGWHDRDTMEIYLDRVQWADLEAARRAREGE